MRLVHLSDLHLGFRQYQRLTPAGINQREADVGEAFRGAIDATIALRPDVVLVAGDVFHTVRPSNPAILYAFKHFLRLRTALPTTPVVIVAGNHDLPRTTETGCILRLFAQMGFYVADLEPRRVALPELNLSVLAVPYSRGAWPAFTPDPTARYNVLLLHGEIAGVLPPSLNDQARIEIPLEDLAPAQWTYVALGHYHVYRQVAPNAFYSGAIEYTSTNVWSESIEQRANGIGGKGFIEHDLATGRHVFHPLAPPRALIDLPAIPAYGLAPADIDRRIAEAVARCDLDGNIARLVIKDIPRHVARELNHAALRDYKRRALHFALDARRPDVTRTAGYGAAGRRPSLIEIVRERLRNRPLEADLDREALVGMGLHYLREAEAQETPLSAEASS